MQHILPLMLIAYGAIVAVILYFAFYTEFFEGCLHQWIKWETDSQERRQTRKCTRCGIIERRVI